MQKNVLIFSDGTGQVGGYSFDEDRTNIYKLFRGTRVCPDSSINPREQVAFYDPGLGSRGEGGFLIGRFARWIYKTVSQATGLGLTQNIIDCYAAIIRLAKPGDRIFVFGFSRGAYTARCVAAVVALCGIPTRNINGAHLPIDEAGSKKLARYAVKHVYQFVPSRKEADATPRQKFLIQTRDRLAMRFRMDSAAFDLDYPVHPNTYPYFVGAFDTVAALSSLSQAVVLAGGYVLAAVAASWLISKVPLIPEIGPYLSFLQFQPVLWALVAIPIVLALGIYIWTHTKFDFDVQGYSTFENFRTLHFTTDWKHKFYDTDLNRNIPYAKHAISIDENRKDFARVLWGVPDDRPSRDTYGNLTFEQVWFPGNHADVGGGYKETESRLSDGALKWMLAGAHLIPDGVKYDKTVLQLYPDPTGIQHDEVKAGFGTIANLLGITWTEGRRKLGKMEGSKLSNAVMHRSVYERFAEAAVPQFDVMGPYRPATLANHVDFQSSGETPKRTTIAAYIEDRLSADA
jgi:uncharacterized protein (DUF2235 family)